MGGAFTDIGGDPEQALEHINVPSYVLDRAGVVRWTNPATERLLGDVRGRHYTSLVAPEDRPRARDVFARKVLGTVQATDTTADLVSTDGRRVTVEISAVALSGGEQVVGVFGLLSRPLDEASGPPHPQLTPRQNEVLRLLEQGRSTREIAQELHLSPETVRNHIRHLLSALGVSSRLEAVAVVSHRSSRQRG
jgi:PAS domain S-box-containing protein